MGEPLAIVGASVRAAAASAVRAGFTPLAADLFADADLRRIATATRVAPYPDGLLDWLRALEPPAWMYTGGLENHPDLVDQMAWVAPLWGNAGDVLARVRSPWLLGEVLREAGLLFPDTRATPDGLPRDGSWLAKTYRGAGGSGVRALDETGDAIAVSMPDVYQQRIDGVPCCAVFVAAEGRAALVGITRQLVGEDWLGAREFHYCGSIGIHFFKPHSLHVELLETVDRIGDVLAARFELIGLIGVDLIVEGNCVWTIEVNPRYTASVEVVERSIGISAIALHAAACTRGAFDTIPAHRIESPVHGKAVLFAKRAVTTSPAFAEWALGHTDIADISPAGTPIDSGRPVVTVLAAGATDIEVERGLRERVAEVERSLYAK